MENESAPENRFWDRIWELKPFMNSIMQTPLNSNEKQMGSPIAMDPTSDARNTIKVMIIYLPVH